MSTQPKAAISPTAPDLPVIVGSLRRELPRLAAAYNVDSLGVFGSYARSEQRPESDLDLLVTFTRPVSLLRFAALENEISNLLGLRVDLVMKSALRPRIGQRILREVIEL